MKDSSIDRNVFGEPLVPCSFDPLTGFVRDGCCRSESTDQGEHWICAVMTDDFLAFIQLRGNDLSTPRPEYDFPGLKAGDRWCLCALRWKESWAAGVAPPVNLQATHAKALEVVTLEMLQQAG